MVGEPTVSAHFEPEDVRASASASGPWRLWRQRLLWRLREGGVLGHLLGLLYRLRLEGTGILVVRIGWPLLEIANRGGRIEVGTCGFFPGVRLECWRGAHIRLGDGTFLNRNVEIVAAGAVSLGRDCMVARDVIIMDTDQHPLPGRPLAIKPVEIGDRVWIGARAIILKGVSIGHDSVIGAGAIVTKSVPPRSVVVGPAARLLHTLDETPARER